jgi:hypothetical protein
VLARAAVQQGRDVPFDVLSRRVGEFDILFAGQLPGGVKVGTDGFWVICLQPAGEVRRSPAWSSFVKRMVVLLRPPRTINPLDGVFPLVMWSGAGSNRRPSAFREAWLVHGHPLSAA